MTRQQGMSEHCGVKQVKQVKDGYEVPPDINYFDLKNSPSLSG